MEIRLQKLLAMAGVASRRKAEELITAGRVTVNGAVVRELGVKAAFNAALAVDGKPVTAEQKVYIMLHKPEGVVTTVTDPFNRATVMDLIPKGLRLFPVGRLDYNTSGLLFLTNDGEWAQSLTHPKHEVSKTYIATVRGVPAEEDLRAFREGLNIDGRPTAPCEADILNGNKLRITIHEGRNRQVRKMCEAIGHPVIKLMRVSVGKVELGDLPYGKWRDLTPREVELCLQKS